MKKIIAIFILVISFSNQGLAKRNGQNICKPRVPTINLEAAIRIVTERHYSGSLSDKEIFIDKAKLICKERDRYWEIGYRLQAYESVICMFIYSWTVQ